MKEADRAPDNISGEHKEDAPHAGEEGGRDKGEEDEPVPEAELPHTGEDGVIVPGDSLHCAHGQMVTAQHPVSYSQSKVMMALH